MNTVYDVLNYIVKYDGNPNAHDMVISDCRKYTDNGVELVAFLE